MMGATAATSPSRQRPAADETSYNGNDASNSIADRKAEEIRRVLSEPAVDLWRLRELALSEGGLVNDSLRKLAWPKLLGLHNSNGDHIHSLSSFGGGGFERRQQHEKFQPQKDDDDVGEKTTSGTSTAANVVVPDSLDAAQIERDISRVTWHLLSGTQRSRNFQMRNKHRKRIAGLLKRKQRRLGDYLNLTLVSSYFYCPCPGKEREEGDSDDGDVKGCSFSIGSKDEQELDGSLDRLRYYQGFHDVASIVLSALGGATLPSMSAIVSAQHLSTPEAATGECGSATDPSLLRAAYHTAFSSGLTLPCQVLLRLSHSHFRDAMRPDFRQLQSALKLIIMPLTAAFDPQLHAHLHDCEMEPYFCLSWIITWFSHDVRDTALVKRLYDFFIVSHPLMSVYASVAMMIHPLNRIEVLGTDCDFACVHNALADLPKNSSNVGWKYLPGDQGSSGYVTGEDDTDDNASYDPSLQDQSIDDMDDLSLGVTSFGGNPLNRARVPFQELIDLSITLMHKIPPRNLLNLAQRYHTQITLEPLMAQSSSIALLQTPPSWGLAPHADSDWVLRQKMREEFGLAKKLNRHQRKNRLKAESAYGGSENNATSVLIFNSSSVRALIASGTGPDGLAEARKLRKKRRLMMRSVAVAVLSVVAALARNYYLSQQGIPMTKSHSQPQHQQQSTMDVLIEDSVSNMLLSSLLDDSDTIVSADGHGVDITSLMEKKEPKISADSDAVITVQEKGLDEDQTTMVDHSQEKVNDDSVCANDEEGHDEVSTTDDVNSFAVSNENTDPHQQQEHGQSTSSSLLSTVTNERTTQAALMILIKSLKNLTTIHRNNRTLDIHLDQLEQHFDFLMMQLMDLLQIGWHQAKAGWLKIAPVLVNALRIGWHHIRAGWIKIAPVAKRELALELEGDIMEWGEDALKTWKKQEGLLRKQGKFIQSVVLDVRKRVKVSKGKKSRLMVE